MPITFKDLPPELQGLARLRRSQSDWDTPFNDDTYVSSMFDWYETPERNDFWQGVARGDDMTSHSMYPKSTNYEIY